MSFLYSVISNAEGLLKALYIQGSGGRATHGATHFLGITGNMELSILPKHTTGATESRTQDTWKCDLKKNLMPLQNVTGF